MGEEVRALFASYYPTDSHLARPDYVAWLYNDNPFGSAELVLARIDGQLAGFMALIPVHLRRGTDVIGAFYVVNVLVDPKHTGKHIFGHMIGAAIEFVKSDGAVLMGHPNALAIRMWHRKRMTFHPELWPRLAKPSFLPKSKVVTIRQEADLEAHAGPFTRRTPSSETHWKVDISTAYLRWRFFNHPVNRYDLRAIQRSGQTVAVQALRRFPYGVRLLIDQFVNTSISAARLPLPFPTVLFRSRVDHLVPAAADVPLPWKKRIQVFATSYDRDLGQNALTELNLTASDF